MHKKCWHNSLQKPKQCYPSRPVIQIILMITGHHDRVLWITWRLLGSQHRMGTQTARAVLFVGFCCHMRVTRFAVAALQLIRNLQKRHNQPLGGQGECNRYKTQVLNGREVIALAPTRNTCKHVPEHLDTQNQRVLVSCHIILYQFIKQTEA